MAALHKQNKAYTKFPAYLPSQVPATSPLAVPYGPNLTSSVTSESFRHPRQPCHLEIKINFSFNIYEQSWMSDQVLYICEPWKVSDPASTTCSCAVQVLSPHTPRNKDTPHVSSTSFTHFFKLRPLILFNSDKRKVSDSQPYL